MGSGASSALDAASMQQFISEDLERAEEVLATAQQPLGIALAQLDLFDVPLCIFAYLCKKA